MLMFGCASFPGTEAGRNGRAALLSAPLSTWLRSGCGHGRLRTTTCRWASCRPRGFDAQAVLANLPPLIKGYLRVGGFFGDGAVVDHQFNTTDVCVIVKTDQLTDKYDRHYRRPSAQGRASDPVATIAPAGGRALAADVARQHR